MHMRAALAPLLLVSSRAPHITRALRHSPVHRSHHPVMSAAEPGEDGPETGEDGAEGSWQPELELARYRLEGRAQSDSLSEPTPSLSDPDTWAAQSGVLKERGKRMAAAEARGKRNKRKDLIDAAGGLSFGATMLGANWAVKEQLLSAESALGGIAGLALLAGVLGGGRSTPTLTLTLTLLNPNPNPNPNPKACLGEASCSATGEERMSSGGRSRSACER